MANNNYTNVFYVIMAVGAVGGLIAQMSQGSPDLPKRKVTVLTGGVTNKRRNIKNKSRRK
jgi:hypothetical protein